MSAASTWPRASENSSPAVAGLAKRRPQLHAYLIGGGGARATLDQMIAAQNAGAHMTFVPACTSDGVARWMAASDLVTLPSYREGCPNVVVEALASGRPVVATDVGGIPELMDDGVDGRLVPPRDAAALEQALDTVLSQPWDADAISSHHSRSWSDVSDEVEQILRI